MSARHVVRHNSSQEAQDPRFSILGVQILNVTIPRALELLESHLRNRDDKTRSVFFVNAHTLNLAAGDSQYRAILNSGDYVFNDGTGVRWAARLQGVRILDNLVGTDFTPTMMQSIAGRGYSYFMLGGDERTVAIAAEYAQKMFPDWTLCGCHHGYILNSPELTSAVIEKINSARPDVLLVGMGNPFQERWIYQYHDRLHVPICMGIGGLFDYWAGNVSRTPQWLRNLGHEWIWRLFQQPSDKFYRYLVGSPLFLARIMLEHWSERGTR